MIKFIKNLFKRRKQLNISVVIGCSHPGVNNTTNKCIGCGKDWNKDLGKL